MKDNAFLVLEDGTVFPGISIGCKGQTVGELVFNTAHVGYQEALTDPSYTAQLLVFTTPHIGNTGCNVEDEESSQFCAAGLVLREKPSSPSNWRAACSFQSYLEKHNVVGIAEIDTRQLTQRLRDFGNMNACIVSNGLDIASAKQLASKFRGSHCPDLLKKISTQTAYTTKEKNSTLNSHIVVYDYGVKHNILRLLTHQGHQVTVVPADTPAEDINKIHPDGIVLSNGPGDPTAFTQQIKIIQELIALEIPTLGICLGHQLLGLACGASISKLKFGHHGINHPVKDLETGAVFINSQNHNFAIDDSNLPIDLKVTHRSLFDNSIQGIEHQKKPFWGRQGHPEGGPGPILIELFQPFLTAVISHSLNQSGALPCRETLI